MLAKIDAVEVDLESLKAKELAGTVASIKNLRSTVESVDGKVGAVAARVDSIQIEKAERTRANEALSEKVTALQSQLSVVCDRLENIETQLSVVEKKAEAKRWR